MELELELERALAAVAEQALRQGARAALETLVHQALRLTRVTGVALHEGSTRVAQAGLEPPPPWRALAPQLLRARDGRTALVVLPQWSSAAERQALARLAHLGSTLLAVRRQQAAAMARQARLCHERRRLERALARWEHKRSRASHDLRTPLLVLQGYVDMLRKGVAGELPPTLERYLARMWSSSQDMGRLLAQRLSPGEDSADLHALLAAAFEAMARSQPGSPWLEAAAKPVPVRGPEPVLALLARSLARGLAAAGAPRVRLEVEESEAPGVWRLRLCAPAERALPARTAALLEGLTARLGGRLAVGGPPGLELSLHLPAASL